MGRPRVLQLFGQWKPQLCFYANRAPFLQSLEERGALLQFRMPDDSVEALIADVGLINVGPGQVRVTVGSPTFDHDRLIETLQLALGVCQPASSTWHCRVRHIIEIDSDYDAARSAGKAGWLHAGDDVTDFAILVDGRSEDADYTYQCEYGVITREEATQRLLSAGRGRPIDIPDEIIDLSDLPDVAAFMDWHWSASLPAPMHIPSAAEEVLARCIALSETNSAVIHSRCVENLPTLNLEMRK